MFQFPGFASKTLCVQVSDTWFALLLIAARGAAASGIKPARSVTLRSNNNKASGGFPHSEIHGSKPIPGSPWLIAGYRVLHRLLLPRHPPNALIALDLTRKKKDPHPCGVRPEGQSSFQISMQLFPPPFMRTKTWLVYLTWTTPPLVLANHRTPTRVRPTTLIISLNDVNAAAFPLHASDWTGKRNRFPIKSKK